MILDNFQPIKKENQLIIGVCGSTTSGKSTLITELLKKLEQHNSHMDQIAMEWFIDADNAPKTDLLGKDYVNLDIKESINWNRYYKQISENNSPILFLDGYLLFADKRSYDIVDICIEIEFNIETDYEIALDRKIHRYEWNKDKVIEKDYLQNPYKNAVNVKCAYFHEIAWPEMIRHPEYRKPQNWRKPLLTLSATNDLQENVSLALNFIEPFIKSYLK